MNNRKTYYQLVGYLFVMGYLLVLPACSTPSGSQEQEDTDKPLNFIVIFADDLGYGDLGVYGNPSIRTPHLDRMAYEGQKWTNFYVGAPVCTPSRAALVTGRLPIRSGMAGAPPNRVLFPDSHRGLPASEITIAEQLKKAGYATACIGKWHLGHNEPYLPTKHGFDYYYGIPYSNDMDNLALANIKTYQGYFDFWQNAPERRETKTFNVPLVQNTEIIERPADQNTITKRYTDEAVKYIKENKDHPFFLYLAHSLPHVPLFAHKDFLGSSKGGLYGDVIQEIDHSVGQVLTTLKEEGMAENTIVVFTSDNGPWLVMGLEGGSEGPLRDGKGSTWDGGMREPCIFWGPGNVKPGVINDLGTTMDLFATFSKQAGVELPDDRIMDGVDLSPVLFDRAASPRKEVFYYRGRELYAIRVGSYKAHLITQGGYGPPAKVLHDPPLLYNLDKDPRERFDVAEKHPEIIQQIMEVVKAHNDKLVKGEDQLKYRGDQNPE